MHWLQPSLGIKPSPSIQILVIDIASIGVLLPLSSAITIYGPM